jgi:hypothetical protein
MGVVCVASGVTERGGASSRVACAVVPCNKARLCMKGARFRLRATNISICWVPHLESRPDLGMLSVPLLPCADAATAPVEVHVGSPTALTQT